MSEVGYIGLGDMGSAMAERLLGAGHRLLVHDIDPEAVERVVDLGARAAASAAEIAEQCDLIELCVPAAHHIDAVLDGPGGLAGAARTGTTLLVHSTVHPQAVQQLNERAAGWDGAAFDVCVGGGTGNARDGELVLFVGGLADLPAAATALFDDLGSFVVDAGPVGAGAAIKIAFNVMTYAQFAAARTGTGLVADFGADPEALIAAWRHVGQLGTLTDRALPLFGMTPATVEELGMGDFMRGHVEIAHKDLDLARAVSPGDPALGRFLAGISDAMATVYSVEEA